MIAFGKGTHIFAWTQPVDMRKSFRALAAVVVSDQQNDPLSGSVYLFVGRNKKRAKVIWFDGIGFCLFQKLLAKNSFAAPWDQMHEGAIQMTSSQLALFFEGNPLAFMGALSLDEVIPQKMTTQIAPIR